MKLLYLSIFVFLLSCTTKMVQINSVEMTNELQISIILDNKTNMELSMKNNSERQLRFSDPKCYVNSIIEIIGKDGKIQQALKVKPDMSCVKNMVALEVGKEKVFRYPYRLNELFQLKSESEYEILLSYKGGIKSSQGKDIEGDVSARQKFVVQ